MPSSWAWDQNTITRNRIVKRFEFNSHTQKEGESIAVYVAELRKIAEYCEYGAMLSDMLRDRLVCGISTKSIQLQQTELTFDKALEETKASAHTQEYTLFHVHLGQNKPYEVTISVNGNPLRMKIDTGASVSVVDKETFNAIRRGEKPLEIQKSSVRLQSYTGGGIPVLGSVRVPVQHNSQTLTLPLLVTEGSGPSLLGRDWLHALRLDWHTIFSVEPSLSLQGVLDKHCSIFKEGLGELKNIKAKIYISEDERPRFFKPYQVPFALRKKVEELEYLQLLDVIQPVQFVDWAAPIVPVMKSDGRVRICKITVNRAEKLADSTD